MDLVMIWDVTRGQHRCVLKDIDAIETINIELEHSVATLFQEIKNLHKENKYLKQTYKDIFDSIKLAKSQTKVNNDSLILQLNKKSMKNVDLKAQLQDKTNVNAELRYIKDVNARTKKPKIMPISNRKPTKNENQSVATQHHITIASETTIHKSSSYFRMLYEKTNLEVAFGKSTCFVRDLRGNELLTGTHRYDLYTISLQESSSPTLICFMAKVSPTQAWLWHRRLSHLNFYTINLLSKNDIMNGLPKLKYVNDQLCSSCKMGKAKRSNFKIKTIPSSKGWLHLLHMDLCGPMWVERINGKKYILVIVDDYSRYTWTYFLRSKDEIPEVLIDFLKMIQHGLQAQVINVQTDKVMSTWIAFRGNTHDLGSFGEESDKITTPYQIS
ncbi:retrovirus-related pol polyprotein from transposon TNT 1-94 [Tanacetum coccineum]